MPRKDKKHKFNELLKVVPKRYHHEDFNKNDLKTIKDKKHPWIVGKGKKVEKDHMLVKSIHQI